MIPYGQRKVHTCVAGHQECGICHDEQKSHPTRARHAGREEVEEQKQEGTRPTKPLNWK